MVGTRQRLGLRPAAGKAAWLRARRAAARSSSPAARRALIRWRCAAPSPAGRRRCRGIRLRRGRRLSGSQPERCLRIFAPTAASSASFPPGTPPLPEHFPSRNRILSGLALGVRGGGSAEKERRAHHRQPRARAGKRRVHPARQRRQSRPARAISSFSSRARSLVEEGWDILQEYTLSLSGAAAAGQPPAGPMTLTAQEAAAERQLWRKLPLRRKKLTQKPLTSRKTGLILTYRKFCRRLSPDEAAVIRPARRRQSSRSTGSSTRPSCPRHGSLSALTLLEVKGYVKRLPARYYELAKK